MGAEDDGVTCREHADGVADDGFGGVGRRSDGADDPVGAVLEGGESVITLMGLHDEVLHTGSASRSVAVLEYLVMGVAHPGLLDGCAGHVLQAVLLGRGLADGIDEGATLGQGAFREGDEGPTGGAHCRIDIVEDSGEVLDAGFGDGTFGCDGHGCWLLRVWSPGEIRLVAVDIRTSDASTIGMANLVRPELNQERVRGAVEAKLCVH